jgi:hypothetical protein
LTYDYTDFIAKCAKIMPTIHAHEYPIKDIFSDSFAFNIPKYQRPYSWGIEQTSELLSDLIGASEGFVPGTSALKTAITPYFLGSIVLIKKETAPEADVIDGQQNTFRSLVFERGSVLAGTKDRCRLKLRERDHDFFEQNVLRDGSLIALAELLKTKLPDPQRRVASNCFYLLERVKELASNRRNALAAFLLQHTYLVVVSTPDLDSAFRIFSVLNDRGLDLTAADILKAEIIGKIPEVEQQASVEAWEDAEEDLGTDRFSELFSHIRMIHGRSKLRKTVLEGVRESVRLFSQPKKFIQEELIPSSETYSAILKQQFESTDTVANKRINRLLALLARLDDTDWVPPAILFLRQQVKSTAAVEAFLRDLERLGSALWLLRRDVNERISRYARLLEVIDKGEDLTKSSSPLQLTDDEKRQAVHVLDGDIYNLTPKTKRTVVLLRLDEALSSGEASYDFDRITVEHVLPQTPDQNSKWCQWWPLADERAKNVHRIGNLALLNRRQNSGARNWELAEKKEKYFSGRSGTSPFAITTEILSKTEWKPSDFQERQERFLNRLKQEWRLH